MINTKVLFPEVVALCVVFVFFVIVISPPARSLSAEETHEIWIRTAKGQVTVMTQQAALAEKNNYRISWVFWNRLADQEALAQMPELALEHTRKSLRLYNKPVDTWNSQGPLVPFKGFSATSLINSGHAAGYEAVLREALQVSITQFGDQSRGAAQQSCQLFVFYLDQKRDSDALKMLDQILQIDLRKTEVSPGYRQNVLRQVADATLGLTKQNRGELALTILNKSLLAQKKTFEPDDRRLADSLVNIAEVNIALGKNEEAERNLLEAAGIYRLYVGDLRLLPTLRGHLQEVWKNLGLNEQASVIDVRPVGWVSPALFRKLGNTELAEQVEKSKRVPGDYIDAQYPFENNRKMFDPHADPSRQMEQLQKEYLAACLSTPYSSRATSALTTLMHIALSEQDWPVLANAAAARCKIYEHTPDEKAGRSTGCVRPPDDRMDYYSRAARANIHMGNIAEGQKWIDRAVNVLPELTCMESIVVASFALDCGNAAMAQKFAEQGDSLLTEQYLAVFPQASATVWTRLGHPERALAIIEKSKKIRSEVDARVTYGQNHSDDRTGFLLERTPTPGIPDNE
jgi:tetratricopeptide (TPR) repeat protein